MEQQRDPRTLRLFDLGPRQSVVVTCQCGRTTLYGNGLLQRRYRIPSDTLLFDLQFRLRCSHCRRDKGFTIAVQDDTHEQGSSHQVPPLIIVDGSAEGQQD